MTERFMVTGATGFIGRRVAAHLSRRGPVLAIARHPAGLSDLGLVPLAADLTTGIPDASAFSGATVVHTAALMNAPDRDSFWRCNVDGTFHALEWAARQQAKHFILFSSGGVYGYGREQYFTEEHRPDPIGFYGYTKLIAEETARAHHRLLGMPVTVVRLFFPYGDGQEKGVFPLISNAVRNGSPLTVHRDGCPRINPVHVEDVASAVERMASSPAGFRVFNLCGDETVSFLDLVSFYEKRHGRKALLTASGQDQGDLLGANGLLKRELGWMPARTIAA